MAVFTIDYGNIVVGMIVGIVICIIFIHIFKRRKGKKVELKTLKKELKRGHDGLLEADRAFQFYAKVLNSIETRHKFKPLPFSID